MTDGQRPDDEARDPLAELIRTAGRREPVPDAARERVRLAVHERWRQEVGRRASRRRRWSAVAAAAAAVVVLALGAWSLWPTSWNANDTSTSMHVATVSGSVGMRQGSLAIAAPVEPGGIVAAGSTVATDDDGRIALALGERHSVRLDRASSVRWDGGWRLELQRGALYVDGAPSASDERGVEVITPFGTVMEVGTQFEVRLDPDAMRVRLRDGKALVRSGGELHPLVVGEEMTVDAEGRTERREVALHGEAWSWMTEIAPMIDMTGKTAQEVLTWIAREGGWTLVFQDQNVARTAAETRLSGSLRGLTLEQSLDAVLPTCGLDRRLQDGTLTVVRGGE